MGSESISSDSESEVSDEPVESPSESQALPDLSITGNVTESGSGHGPTDIAQDKFGQPTQPHVPFPSRMYG